MRQSQLTKKQEHALDALARDDVVGVVRVVGWDTAIEGPLVALGPGTFVAISPKGKSVDRSQSKAITEVP